MPSTQGFYSYQGIIEKTDLGLIIDLERFLFQCLSQIIGERKVSAHLIIQLLLEISETPSTFFIGKTLCYLCKLDQLIGRVSIKRSEADTCGSRNVNFAVF